MKKEFQIEQNYGESGKSWIYIEADPDVDQIKKVAIDAVKKEWDETYKPAQPSILNNPRPCRPTILIREYANGKTVRNGIRLKTRWR